MVMSSPLPLVDDTQTEWRIITKALRDYLRHTYANVKLGVVSETVPLRLSAYNGKGLGYYATGADGRADWSEEFSSYIERVERRTPRDRDLRFGYHELAAAMDQLALRYPELYQVITALDVHGVRIEDYCLESGRNLGLVRRQRKKATFFLYETLRLGAIGPDERIDFVVIRVI